jgi:cytochrome c oxidase cbb3-type subunit I/II
VRYKRGALHSLFAFTDDGRLAVQAWVDILERTFWLNHIRAIGGAMYLVGALIAFGNLGMTALGRKVVVDNASAPPLGPEPRTETVIAAALKKKSPLDMIYGLHDLVERWPLLLTAATLLALSIGGAFQIIPNLIQGALSPTMPGVKPYSALELAGRDIYISEGCNGCHTLMARTLRADTARFGDNQLGFPAYSRAGEDIYDRPHLWSSKRTGPDLDREGLIRPDPFWHYQHFYNARNMPGLKKSTMPGYPQLYEGQTDYASLSAKMRLLAASPMNTPYSNEDIQHAESDAKADTAAPAARIEAIYGNLPADVQANLPTPEADAKVIALIAYMKKLGRDLKEGAAQ